MKNIKLNLLILLSILTIFSCKKDKDDDDSFESKSSNCQIQRIYCDGDLVRDYTTLSNNRIRENKYNSDTLSSYGIYTKNEEGQMENIKYYWSNDVLYYSQELVYNNGRDLPEILNFTYYNYGEVAFQNSTVIFYNDHDCKVKSYEFYDEFQSKTGRDDFSYSDDNCSHIVSRYYYDYYEYGDEYLESEVEYVYDNKNSIYEAVSSSYQINHNMLSRTNHQTGALDSESVYQYDENGFPITKSITIYNHNDGTSSNYNYRYEYDCD